MTIKEFTECAIKFSQDTSNWHELDHYKFYTTDYPGYWRESCDNSNGGLYLKWAFHKSEEQIIAEAPQEMLDQIADMIENHINDRGDYQQLAAILDYMK